MLSKEVLEALRVERAELSAKRERLEGRIAAIDALLPAQDPPRAAKPQQNILTEIYSSLGLRGAIRAVLAKRPGLTGAEIASAMEAGKFQIGGETPLKVRVSNEAIRMWKNDHLHRDGSNRYSLAAPESADGAA